MNPDQWTLVDEYIDGLFAPSHPVLDAALRELENAGLPPIQVTPNQGKLLSILARSVGARRILEIGTLAGYSAIWLAQALPAGGRLITLEANPDHAAVARRNLARAGLADTVEIRLGPALNSLADLASTQHDPFDFVFIDADKPGYVDYLDWALKLTRRGALIVADNVVRSGAVIDAANPEINVQAMRRFNARLASEPRLSATLLQTVGRKGYDGLAIAVVLST